MDFDRLIKLDDMSVKTFGYAVYVLRKLYGLREQGYNLHDYYELKDEIDRLNDVLNEMTDKFLTVENSEEK